MDVVGDLTQQDPLAATNHDPVEENEQQERPKDIVTVDFAEIAGASAGHGWENVQEYLFNRVVGGLSVFQSATLTGSCKATPTFPFLILRLEYRNLVYF